MATVWPACTALPAGQLRRSTVPARGAVIGNSIFIDSTTSSVCPAATVSPSATSRCQTLPCTALATAWAPSGSMSSGGGTAAALSSARYSAWPAARQRSRSASKAACWRALKAAMLSASRARKVR